MDRYTILKAPDPTPEELEIFRKQRAQKAHKKLASEQNQPPNSPESIISQYFQTGSRSQQLAVSMADYIRTRLDNESLARRIFSVDLISGEIPPVYNHVNGPAYVFDEEGQHIQTIVRELRVLMPMFEVVSFNQIPFSQDENPSNLVQRIQDRAFQEILQVENFRTINLLRTVSNGNTILVAAQFNSQNSIIDTLHTALNNLEKAELRATTFLLNTQDYYIIRQYLPEDLFAEVASLELRQAGLLCSLWGVSIQVNQGIPQGEIYLLSEPIHTGILSIRTNIVGLPADTSLGRTWSFFELIGMGCLNPSSITRITVPSLDIDP